MFVCINTPKHWYAHTYMHAHVNNTYTHPWAYTQTLCHTDTHTHTPIPAVQLGAVQAEGGSQIRTSATPEKQWAARQRKDSAGSSLRSRPAATAAGTGPTPCPKLACTHSRQCDYPWSPWEQDASAARASEQQYSNNTDRGSVPQLWWGVFPPMSAWSADPLMVFL